jgi:hypothetical protein
MNQELSLTRMSKWWDELTIPILCAFSEDLLLLSTTSAENYVMFRRDFKTGITLNYALKKFQSVSILISEINMSCAVRSQFKSI